ncbi:MAG TPA: PAS domain S-box protein, partial [Gemmatimonadaceae bacterium]|nr:PAS domain S-box protein [Gemmatimonadaceae bacterium]
MTQSVTPRPAATAVPDSGRRRKTTTARVALILALAILVVRLAVGVAHLLLTPEDTTSRLLGLSGLVLGIAVLLAALVALRAVERDLVDHERLTRALQASEARFSGILDIAADAIITVGEDQQILHYNQGAEEIFGWSESEMLGQPLERLLPERYRAAHRHHIERFGRASEVARRMGERREIFGRRKDGSDFPAEASISRLEVAGGRLYTVVLRDITARRRQQMDELFLSQAAETLGVSLDYESTLRSVAHLAVPHLADCAVLDVDEGDGAFRRIVSVHEDPELTRALRTWESHRVESPDWPFPAATAAASESTIVRQALTSGWEREGAPDDVAAARVRSLGITGLMTLPLPARGRVIGSLTLLATTPHREYGPEQRGVGESLARLAAAAIENAVLYRTAQRATLARDEILGVVSHDLRNPLSAVTMCARVLLSDTAPDPAGRADLAGTI